MRCNLVAPVPRKPKQRGSRIVTVAQAAKTIGASTGTVYNWLRLGHVPFQLDERGRKIMRYADLKKHVAKLRHEYREWQRIKAGKLTDEEFIQRMWDNDPD